jgi:hypothetical protein
MEIIPITLAWLKNPLITEIVSIDFTFLKLKLALDLLVLFTVVCRAVRVICLITMLDMGVIKIKLVPKSWKFQFE